MSFVPIKYIGAKARKADTVADTGLVWGADTIHLVPQRVADRLLRHGDVWGQCEAPEGAQPAEIAEQSVQEPQETEGLKVGLPNITAMSKAHLGQLAQSRFGITLDPTMKVGDMRAKIVALENSGRQRGD